MAQKIKDLLERFLVKEESWHFDLLRNWNTILGKLHTKVQLEKIEKDTLILGVYDSCWLQELYLMSPLLLKTINQSLDQPRIKQLRFRKIGIFKKQEAKKNTKTSRVLKPVVLTSEQKEALNSISDAQLRAALENFLIRCHQER